MKAFLLSAALASVISLAWISWLGGPAPGSEHSLAQETANQWVAIAQIQKELEELRAEIPHSSIQGVESSPQAHLNALEQMQKQIDGIQHSIDSQETEPTVLRDGDSAYRPGKATNQNQEFETYLHFERQFDSDEGTSLGEGEEVIEQVLHGRPDIAVSAIQCRASICRVSYEESPQSHSPLSQDSDLELVDELVSAMNGQTVELSYAKGPSGERLMYMRLP
ncbi:MAG: hypothetical protein AAF699_14935 [Pseudomonadota bacterium]